MLTRQFVLIAAIAALGSCITTNTLSSQCLCDVSSSCDYECCCDSACSAEAIVVWNSYSKCASGGFPVPFCSSWLSSEPHKHDLYSGVRMIYDVIKRLFCIHSVNFVDPTQAFASTTTSEQITAALPAGVPAINPTISSLPYAGFASLPTIPFKDSLGRCQQSSSLFRDMNNINQVYCWTIANTSAATNKYLSIQQFKKVYPNIRVYSASNASSSSAGMMSNPITDCQSVNTCRNVIRSIHLFVVKKSSGVSLDTTSSYLVVEDLQTVEFPKYVKVEYSLTFLSTAGEVPRSNSKGYNIGSAIQLLYGSNDQYYRINNPVNLAYRSFNGACTNSVGSLSEVPFRFGVNALFTCTGTSKFITNIKSSFNYVGAVGAATNSLSDYVSINYPSDISSNTGVRLVFSYIRIGTASDKQYQIIKANATVISESALYVQFNAAANPLVLVTPPPPSINLYLPNDFLYPFA